jgi:aminomethyltransferase
MRASPLHEAHVAAGAVLTEFAGWRLPLRYGSETAEHEAVRSGVGVFDLSHMGEIEVRGPDAAGVLDAVLVGDLGGLRPGRAKYTLLCDDGGGVVDDLVVYRLGPEDLLVVANAANVGEVAAALAAAAPGRDAAVADVTADVALVAVQGPAAPEALGDVLDDPAAVLALRRYGCLRTEVAGVPAFVGRTGYTGEDGFELYLPAARARAVWDAVLAAGRDHGAVPAGLAARDTLRLEAGMALYGHELTRDTDPFEAGLGRLVALGKPGGFPGREALADRAAREPARRLVGLLADGRRILRHGQALTAPSGAGTVTSGAWSPTLQRSIALAYLPAGDAEPGTVVTADVRGTAVTAVVTATPFHRPPPGGAT